MATVRSISEKQLEANRRNAQQSTGPKTAAGKQASRLNALTHGLLAKEVVVTVGDYKEDEREFAELLAALREEFKPVGVAEDLEVQKIALGYWRKRRAVRFENGAIRRRTVDMRERERGRRESNFLSELRFGSDFESRARGVEYLIERLEAVKQAARDGKVPEESLKWLVATFPDTFALPDKSEGGGNLADGRPFAPTEYQRQLMNGLDEQLDRLSALQKKLAAIESRSLKAKISMAALPGPGAVDKLIRYETSNERELDRALKRLERMQERRQTNGSTPPAN